MYVLSIFAKQMHTRIKFVAINVYSTESGAPPAIISIETLLWGNHEMTQYL